MKKAISLLLTAVLFLLIPIHPVSAADNYSLIGDVDVDGEITILDATCIQRALASLESLSILQNYLANVDGADGMTILDATCIQRRLAEISNDFWKSRLYHWHAEITTVSTTVSSSTVQVGTAVGFTVVTTEHEIEDEYEVYVDGVLTSERTAHRYFTYTFDTEGVFNISVVAYDPFGGEDVYTMDFHAVKGSESPVITYAVFDRNTNMLTVRASGGTAPYEYQYIIRNNDFEPVAPPGPTYASQFEFGTDGDNNYYLICRYCSDSAVEIPTYMMTPTLTYHCEIQVRGADGAESDVKKIQFILR